MPELTIDTGDSVAAQSRGGRGGARPRGTGGAGASGRDRGSYRPHWPRRMPGRQPSSRSKGWRPHGAPLPGVQGSSPPRRVLRPRRCFGGSSKGSRSRSVNSAVEVSNLCSTSFLLPIGLLDDAAKIEGRHAAPRGAGESYPGIRKGQRQRGRRARPGRCRGAVQEPDLRLASHLRSRDGTTRPVHGDLRPCRLQPSGTRSTPTSRCRAGTPLIVTCGSLTAAAAALTVAKVLAAFLSYRND